MRRWKNCENRSILGACSHDTNLVSYFLSTLYSRVLRRQAGRRLDSAPSANVVAMATKIGPCSSPLVGPNISGLSRIQPTYRRFCASENFGVRGLNQKSKKNSYVECHMENWRPKMGRFHRETKKEEAIWRSSVTDIQTDRESTTKNNRLLG